MIVSLNEFENGCGKAFRALGFPDGADAEAAKAVLWLETAGLGGAALVAAALPGFEADGAAGAPLGPGLTAGEVDLGTRSLLVLGGGLLDFVLADAAVADRSTLRLRGGRDALALLGLATQRPWGGLECEIAWSAGGLRRKATVQGSAEMLALIGPPESDPGEALVARIDCYLAPDEPLLARTQAQGWRPWLEPAALFERQAAAVERGIEVDDGLWSRLLALGSRLLVPATAQSRARGAGGGSYND